MDGLVGSARRPSHRCNTSVRTRRALRPPPRPPALCLMAAGPPSAPLRRPSRRGTCRFFDAPNPSDSSRWSSTTPCRRSIRAAPQKGCMPPRPGHGKRLPAPWSLSTATLHAPTGRCYKPPPKAPAADDLQAVTLILRGPFGGGCGSGTMLRCPGRGGMQRGGREERPLRPLGPNALQFHGLCVCDGFCGRLGPPPAAAVV